MKDSSNKTDRILSVMAVAISLAAFGFSTWQGCETRRHNRLSVKPKLDILPQRSSADDVGLVLSNKGSGPALIKRWTITVRNEPSTGWLDVLLRLPALNMPWVSYSSFFTLRAGETHPILWVTKDDWAKRSDQERSGFNEALKTIKVVLTFESVYEEPDEYVWDGAVAW